MNVSKGDTFENYIAGQKVYNFSLDNRAKKNINKKKHLIKANNIRIYIFWLFFTVARSIFVLQILTIYIFHKNTK